MSYLKTKKVLIEALDETIELVELNALGQREMINLHSSGDMFSATAAVVKYGTKKWRESTIDEILEQMPLDAIQQIAEAVTELSGLDEEKNSESSLSESSSTR